VVAELVERKVEIILAANVAATRAAARATKTIPIVIIAVFDPVGIGVVKSLERPGTNVTGTTIYAPQLIGDRLRILKRLVPQLEKVAMALNGQNPNNAAQLALLRSEAEKLGVSVEPLDIRKPEDVDAAFDKALAFGAQGLMNAVDTFAKVRAGGRGSETQTALHFQRCGICDSWRVNGARSRSLRGLLRCRQLR
jgi:putative ABC transport system substrate-binding protein